MYVLFESTELLVAKKGEIDGMSCFGVRNNALALSLKIYILATVRIMLIIFQRKPSVFI